MEQVRIRVPSKAVRFVEARERGLRMAANYAENTVPYPDTRRWSPYTPDTVFHHHWMSTEYWYCRARLAQDRRQMGKTNHKLLWV